MAATYVHILSYTMVSDILDNIAYSIILSFPILLLFLGCQPDTGSSSSAIYNVDYLGDRNVAIDTLTMEKVYLELDAGESSFQGFTHVNDGKLLLLDEQTSEMFTFDTNGNLVKRTLGRGEGPNELPGYEPMFYHTTPDGRHVFIGGMNDLYIFDEDLNRISTLQIGWQGVHPDALDGDIDPENDRAYNMAYYLTNIRASNRFIYLALIGAPPLFLDDFNLATEKYVREGRILARIDIQTGEVVELIGRLSPVFAEKESVRYFAYPLFDVVNGDSLVFSFFPDPLIYRSDEKFHVINSFGVAGTAMNTEYRAMPDASDANEYRQYFLTERRARGFYTSLSVFEDRDLIFRGYTRGQDAPSDGLQVYKEETLIADVDVPRHPSADPFEGFEIVGYIKPYFYSNVFTDDEYEDIWVYRFKIEQ